jgi:hypothetical protein
VAASPANIFSSSEPLNQKRNPLSRIFDSLRVAEQSRSGNAHTSGVVVGTFLGPYVPESANSPQRQAPTALAEPPAAHPPAEPPPELEERRKHRRAAVKLAVRVRGADGKDGDLDEVLETANACRGGLYFLTTSGRFYPGMRLRITCPYNSRHDRVAVRASEESGEVRRIESISDRKLAVAVKLVGSTYARPRTGGAVMDTTRVASSERRISKRQPFSATAIVIDRRADTRLVARCSDLSLTGCYADTLNPFPERTTVHLELRREEGTFEGFARVSVSHAGMGMGIAFTDMFPEQLAVLASWLGEEKGESFPVVEQPTISSQPDATMSPDRERLTRLICLLQSKGLLTKAELSSLLSDPTL